MPAGMNMSPKSPSVLAEAQSDSQTGLVLPDGVSCTHDKCNAALASVSAVRTDHGLKSTRSVAANPIVLPVNLLCRSSVDTEPSQPPLTALSLISTHLRV